MESTVFTHTIATVYNSSILKLEDVSTPAPHSSILKLEDVSTPAPHSSILKLEDVQYACTPLINTKR